LTTQEDLILKQFAGARKNLGQQKVQAQDQLKMDLNRQNAVTGASGGRTIKAAGKASKGLEQAFGTAEAELSSQEAGQMRENQAQKDAQAYATAERQASQAFGSSEREASQAFGSSERQGAQGFASGERQASQQFASSESQRQEQIQKSQFGQTYGLQMKQFNESKDQFKKQMDFQMSEFSENKRTNLINAMTAFEKSGLGNPERFNQILNSVNRIRGRI